MNDALLFHHAL